MFYLVVLPEVILQRGDKPFRTFRVFREKMVDRDERIRHYREPVNKAAAAVVFCPLIHGVAHIIPAIDPTHQRA